MPSLAPKARKEESEFDDLLGQLVDELAMTPASESAVSFTPQVPVAPAHVDSTQALAAEAAAAAQARAAAPQPIAAPNNNAVKIAGIFAAALSTVAIAALFVFNQQNADSRSSADPVAQPAAPAPEPKVELPAVPAAIAAPITPVVVAPVPTPEPVVAPLPVEPTKVDKPKPRKRVDKPKPDKPKPSTDDEFDGL
jgi:hypothetical protein